MELAQALILTNALGGFSSLGRHSDARPAPHGGVTYALDDQHIEVVCEDGRFQIYLLEPPGKLTVSEAAQPTAQRGSALPESLLPGRLLIQSKRGIIELPLMASEDHLTADSHALMGPLLVSVELTVTGRPRRTPFLPAQPALFEEE